MLQLNHRVIIIFRKLENSNFSTYIPTINPSVFAIPEIDPNINLSMWKHETHKFFSHSPKYIHPSEMNYEYPRGNTPEFAFCGRSNVGKSSLIESLLGNPKIVKISKTPGI